MHSDEAVRAVEEAVGCADKAVHRSSAVHSLLTLAQHKLLINAMSIDCIYAFVVSFKFDGF